MTNFEIIATAALIGPEAFPSPDLISVANLIFRLMRPTPDTLITPEP